MAICQISGEAIQPDRVQLKSRMSQEHLKIEELEAACRAITVIPKKGNTSFFFPYLSSPNYTPFGWYCILGIGLSPSLFVGIHDCHP